MAKKLPNEGQMSKLAGIIDGSRRTLSWEEHEHGLRIIIALAETKIGYTLSVAEVAALKDACSLHLRRNSPE